MLSKTSSQIIDEIKNNIELHRLEEEKNIDPTVLISYEEMKKIISDRRSDIKPKNNNTVINKEYKRLINNQKQKKYHKTRDAEVLEMDNTPKPVNKNHKKTWDRLDESSKLNRIVNFSSNYYKSNSSKLIKLLIGYFRNENEIFESLIEYDNKLGEIISISGLEFDKKTKEFNIKTISENDIPVVRVTKICEQIDPGKTNITSSSKCIKKNTTKVTPKKKIKLKIKHK